MIDEFDHVKSGTNILDTLNHSDFEHLSQYDPDDEFLQSSSSISLLQSILQDKHDFAESSEYSIIDDSASAGVMSLNSSMMSKGSIRLIKS